MKKVLALALALVMALSMSAMAFAAVTTCTKCGTVYDAEKCPTCSINVEGSTVKNGCPYGCGAEFTSEVEFNKHLVICPKNQKECTKCHEIFGSEAAYNEHIETCTVGDTKDYINLDVKTILDMIIDLVKSNLTQWGDIESVVVRIIDFVENMGKLGADKASVLGAVDELEASLADVKIPGLDELLNQLKAKIKAMYAGEKATTVEETTVAEVPAETGSSSVAGIAAFAAISVAAAAAYVCTTKKSK